MNLYNIMQTDLLTIEEDMGSQTMSWSGVDIDIIPSSLSDAKNFEGGGYEVMADQTFTVRVNSFPGGVIPANKDRVIFRGKTYRIDQIVTTGNPAFIRLFLVDTNKGV